jgi:uncharacterized membrane protein
MTKSRREWKKAAKGALKGNYSVAILGMFLANLAGLAASMITEFFFPGEGAFTIILAEIFSFVISLVANIVVAGYSYMTLRLARGLQTQTGDILYFFKNEPDRVITSGFVMVLLETIASLPVTLYSYLVPVGISESAQIEWEIRFLELMAVCILLQILVTVPFTLVYYILADRADLTGIQALKESARMMKGHIGAYLVMMLSFVPIILGSVLTLYISLFWILPYIMVTEAVFYRDLNGEFIEEKPQIDVVYPEELPGAMGDSRNDYNSEA